MKIVKFSEIANRLTGISTTLVGVSWQPTDLEVNAARLAGGPYKPPFWGLNGIFHPICTNEALTLILYPVKPQPSHKTQIRP